MKKKLGILLGLVLALLAITSLSLADECAHTGAHYVSNGNGTHDFYCSDCHRVLVSGEKCTAAASADCGAQANCVKCLSPFTVSHIWGTYVSNNDATCLQDGTKTAECTRSGCKATNTVQDTGSATGHAWGEYISNGDATCTNDGTKTRYCQNKGCTASETVTDKGSALGHLFGEWVYNDDATCFKGCSKERHCLREGCRGAIYVTPASDPLGHTFTDYVSNGDATCFTDGTKTAKCVRYGKDGCTATDTVVDEGSAGHVWSAVTYTWSNDLTSCTATRVCTRDASHVETEKVAVTMTTTAPTCVQDGKNVYTAVFTASWAAAQVKEETLPATGHSYKAVVTKPTCTKGGYTTYTCEKCGHTYVADRVSSRGHRFSDWTPMEGGVHHATCSRCNYVATEPCVDFDYVVVTQVEEKAATSTDAATATDLTVKVNKDVPFTLCPICGQVKDDLVLERVKAKAEAVTNLLPSGEIMVRTGSLACGEKIMSVTFTRSGKLSQPTGKVAVTLSKDAVAGCTLKLLHADGTEEDLTVTETEDEISFTLDFAEGAAFVLHLAEE